MIVPVIVRLWVRNVGKMIKNSIEIKAEYDIIEVDEICAFLKNEVKSDGFGLLIIAIQGKYLISTNEVQRRLFEKIRN